MLQFFKTKLSNQRVVGFLCLALSQLISSANDIFFKILGQQLPSVEVTFLRFLFAALFLLGWIGLVQRSSLKTSYLQVHTMRGFVLYCGMALWCLGLNLIPLTDAIVINFTIPLFTLLLAKAVLKEEVGLYRWGVTCAGFLGVLIVADPFTSQFNPSSIILMVAALLFACSDIINKIFVAKEDISLMLFYTALFTCLTGLIPTVFVWVTPNLTQLLLLAILGCGANALLFFILKAYERLDASATAPMRYVELILSAIAGYLFFGEVPKLNTWLGALFIVPAVIAVVLSESSSKMKQEEEGSLSEKDMIEPLSSGGYHS